MSRISPGGRRFGFSAWVVARFDPLDETGGPFRAVKRNAKTRSYSWWLCHESVVFSVLVRSIEWDGGGNDERGKQNWASFCCRVLICNAWSFARAFWTKQGSSLSSNA